jgi:DNA-binding NtrC family response regulator
MASIQAGDEHILLIDDQSSVLDVEKKMIERLGYKVIGTTEAVAAIAIFQADPKAFDLVITDMTMPGMTGDTLAEKILEIRADIPIIICSGYSELISQDQATELGIREFLMKPVGIIEMSDKIRSVSIAVILSTAKSKSAWHLSVFKHLYLRFRADQYTMNQYH